MLDQSKLCGFYILQYVQLFKKCNVQKQTYAKGPMHVWDGNIEPAESLQAVVNIGIELFDIRWIDQSCLFKRHYSIDYIHDDCRDDDGFD